MQFMDTGTILTYLVGVSFLFYIVGFLSGKLASADSPAERRKKLSEEEKMTIPGKEGKVEVKLNEGELYSDKSYAPKDQVNNGDRFFTVIWKSIALKMRVKKRKVKMIEESEISNFADVILSKKN